MEIYNFTQLCILIFSADDFCIFYFKQINEILMKIDKKIRVIMCEFDYFEQEPVFAML